MGSSGFNVNPSGGSDGQLVQSDFDSITGEKYKNPAMAAFDQHMKDRLNQDASYSALDSAVNTHFGAIKA
ncbi:hypothetical protein H9X75_10090, partial [Fusobacterium mortiferum]|uniref:hypothetical protein n=1 Tax=Fusobacterium mortiferum TaxID=850 RepID=UPI0019561A53|nr:hypothetical protein [Fusobacterium mortiferum]